MLRTHERIAAAILAGEAETAEALSRQHLDAMVRYIAEATPGVMEELVVWR